MPFLPSEFRRIRLELAREPGHPEGSRATGYELVAPLNEGERLSPKQWRKHKDACRVHRFREGEDDLTGRLARRPGGSWISTTMPAAFATTNPAIDSATSVS